MEQLSPTHQPCHSTNNHREPLDGPHGKELALPNWMQPLGKEILQPYPTIQIQHGEPATSGIRPQEIL